jgi:protein transport protein SEC13
MVHDCQLDWYGRRLATCSSDRTVKIFDVEESSAAGQGSTVGGAASHVLLDTLRGHDGPVWAVAWGHPKFGSILASAGYDGKVFVWREVVQGQQQQSFGQPQTQNARWEKIKEHGLHGASGA